MKLWVNRAKKLLAYSLDRVPQELNELDWKEELSPKNEKLSQHLSAFANLPGGGFLVFGIINRTGSAVGVNKHEADRIVERLSALGRDTLDPVVAIDHAIENLNGISVLLIHIKESAIKPVHLKSGGIEDAWIRTGGCTRKASRQEIGGLMLNSKTPQFEELHASKLRNDSEILDLLDYRSIYKLLNKPIPQKLDGIIHWMKDEKMINEIDGTGYYITNFGALAAAHNLRDFDDLSRKSIRLIKYKGINKLETEKEYPGSKGYAIGFDGLITFVKALLPASEIIKNALRTETTVYPEIALRKLL